MGERQNTYWAFVIFSLIFTIGIFSVLFNISSKIEIFVLLFLFSSFIFIFFKSGKKSGIIVLLLILVSIVFYNYVNSKKLSYYKALSQYEKTIESLKSGNISGIIISDPEKYKKNRVFFKLKINDNNDFSLLNGFVLKVYVNTENFPQYFRGESISLYGRFYSLSNYSNFYKNFLSYSNLSTGIIGSIYVKSDKLIIKEGIKNYLFFMLSKYKNAFSKFASENSKSKDSISIVKAISIGQRKAIPEKVKFLWKESGIYHLLAISGAHVGIISLFIFYFLKFTGLSKRKIYTLQILIILTFMLFIGNNPPVVRASFMIILYFLGKLLWKDTDLLHLISITGILYLVASPLSVVNIGFILTYYITLSLIMILREMKGIFAVSTKLEQSFYIVFIAFLVSMPLNIYFFNYLPLGSLILNTISVFIMPFIIFFAVFSLLSFWAIPSIAIVFLDASSFLVKILNLFGEKVGSPLSVRIPTPPLWLVLLTIILLFLPLLIRKKRIIGLILFSISFILLIFYPEKNIKKPAVFFLDVGEGDSSYIEIPKGKRVLVDCGGSYKKDNFIGEYIVSDFLFKRRVRNIDSIFISHFHPDHYYGCIRILNNFKVKKLYFYDTVVGKNISEVIEAARVNKVKIVKLHYGDIIKVGMGEFKVIHPNKEIIEKITNNDSMVLLFSLNGHKILYTGDIEKEAEKKIIKREEPIRAEILKVAHHGSRTSSLTSFLKRVQPKFSIISVGKRNRYHFPSKLILERLNKLNTKVLRTDRDGGIWFLLTSKIKKVASKN